jgi:hypothetical protein
VVRKLATQRKADHIVFVSSKQDKKNPLEQSKKIQYLELMFPNTKFISATDDVDCIGSLHKYKNVVMVTTADSVNAYKKLLGRGNFERTEVVPAGNVCPDSDDKIVKAAKSNYAAFKACLPSSVRELDAKRLMNDVRIGLDLEPIKEQINLVKDDLREQYFRGEIFNEGDIVESDNEVYRIIKRGSNHLLLQNETGLKVSKWIQDVQLTEREFMLDEKQLQEADSTTAGSAAKEAEKAKADTAAAQQKLKFTSEKEALAKKQEREAEALKNMKTEEVVDKNSKYNIAKSVMSLSDFRKSIGQNTSGMDPVETEIAHKVHDGLVGNAHMNGDHGVRHRKVKYHLGEASAATKLQKAFQREQEKIASERKAGEELLKNPKPTVPVKEDVVAEGYWVHREQDTKVHHNTVAQLRQAKHPANLKVTDHKHKNLGTVADVLRNQTLFKTEEVVSEGNGYDDNRTGFAKKPREDDEYHNTPKPKFKARSLLDRPHTVHVDGKPWKKFPNGHQAQAAAKTLRAKGKEANAVAHFREETEEQQGTRSAQLKRFKDQAKEAKLGLGISEAAYKGLEAEDKPGKVKTAVVKSHPKAVKIETVEGWKDEKKPVKEEFEDINEEELAAQVEADLDALTEEDYLEAYDDNELAIIDEDTGEEIEALEECTELMEVLSRQERIKARARMRRSQTKRERREKVALRQFSTPKVANKRARRMAVSALKKRLLRGTNPAKASVGQKERVERFIAQRRKIVDRLAARMVSRVKQVEKARMSHKKFTKPNNGVSF